MRLDTFIIADAVAAPSDDGKFYIHGGGLSRFEVPVVPFPMPLAVLIRLEVTEDELRFAHHLLITLRGPAGVPNIPPLDLETRSEESPKPLLDEELRFIQVALTLPAQVVKLGVFHLELCVDGKKLGDIPLPVKMADAEQMFSFEHGDDDVIRLAPGVPVRGPAPRAKRPPPPPKKAKRRR